MREHETPSVRGPHQQSGPERGGGGVARHRDVEVLDDGVVVDGLLTIRGEDCPFSLAATLTHQPNGGVAVHATGTFDRMTSPLRRAPRWLISASVDIVVDAVLHPIGEAR